MSEKIFSVARFTINPGNLEAFREKASACMEAIMPDLAGTQAYEWFLQEDGLACSVLEIYDGINALNRHGRQVGRIIPQILTLGALEVDFAGDMTPEMLAQYRKFLPGAQFAGARMFGKCRAPAPGAASANPGQKIVAFTRFSVHPGQEALFRERAQQCFELVDATEPGTSGYEWFINDAGTECLVIDIYDSAEALRAHTSNAEAKMSQVLEVASSQVQIFGAVPPDMVFRPELGVRYVAPWFQGIL